MAGPFAWKFIGDAARISSILELFTVLAVVTFFRPTWALLELIPRSRQSGSSPIQVNA
jgi:hypothetical protein